jgi:hypothetical protein
MRKNNPRYHIHILSKNNYRKIILVITIFGTLMCFHLTSWDRYCDPNSTFCEQKNMHKMGANRVCNESTFKSIAITHHIQFSHDCFQAYHLEWIKEQLCIAFHRKQILTIDVSFRKTPILEIFVLNMSL